MERPSLYQGSACLHWWVILASTSRHFPSAARVAGLGALPLRLCFTNASVPGGTIAQASNTLCKLVSDIWLSSVCVCFLFWAETWGLLEN